MSGAAPRLLTLRNLYSSKCPVCGGSVPDLSAATASDFDRIVAEIAASLYTKKLDTGTIPKELYEQTAGILMDAVFSGLGGSSFGYDDPNNTLAAYMRQNIYSFSAAKSLTQMQAFNELLIGEDGQLRSKEAFTAAVAKTGALFNKTHLATERANAIAQAQEAQTWNEFKSDDYLQVSTAGDDRVRPEHARLDGFTALKSDAVWRRLWPPFDWGCRCHVIPGLAKNVKDFKTAELLKDANVPAYFQTNSGLTKFVFDKDHPHFINGFRQEKQLTAEANYAMPSVKKIYADSGLPEAKTVGTKAEANEWWTKKAGDLKGHIDVKDRLGATLRFDNDFRVHVMEDNKDNRWRVLSNLIDIVSNPDEVWTNRTGNKLETYYIKYYEDFPYVIRANDTRAYSMNVFSIKGKLNEASLIKTRRGVLLYRNN